MARAPLVAAALLLTALVSLALPAIAAEDEAKQEVLLVKFVEPRGQHGWLVEANVGGLKCRGVVEVNPGYLQARAVSPGLVVLPLYYVLSSVCDSSVSLVTALDGLARLGAVRVVLEAPGGYVVRSGMDWRGFGSAGGPYVVPGPLLRRYYLYDGVVLADSSRYMVVDYPSWGLSLVVYRGFRGAGLGVLLGAVRAAERAAEDVFGVSPRSPVVAVLAAPREFLLLAPATAYSLGGVFLVVDSLAGRGPGWYVHVFAHEAVHGWVNDGLVYGDFSFGEAVVEFVALRGLYLYNRSLYYMAAQYVGEGVDSGEPYAVWMRAHLALWAVSVSLCSGDPYSWALREIFGEALNSSTPRIYSVIDVLRLVEERCGPRPLEAWGVLLPHVEELNVTRVLGAPGSLLSQLPGLVSTCSSAGSGSSTLSEPNGALSPQTRTRASSEEGMSAVGGSSTSLPVSPMSVVSTVSSGSSVPRGWGVGGAALALLVVAAVVAARRGA